MMFVGPDGDVVPSLTESEMREVDRVAIEETGPNLFQMMENAGRGLAVTALEMLDDRETGLLSFSPGPAATVAEVSPRDAIWPTETSTSW